MAAQNTGACHTQRLGRLHIFLPFDGNRLPPHNARHIQPQHRPDRQKHQHKVAAKEHHQHDDEKDERQGIQDINDPHHHLVRAPADESRRGPVNHPDHHRDKTCKQANGQRHAARNQGAGQQITPGVICAKEEIFLLHLCRHGGG